MEVRIENINQDVNLVADIKQLITNARLKVATVANAGITMLYWHIGERINREVLGNQRAEYGKRIVSTVSAQLQQEYGGQEFSTRNLRRMMQFADYFPDPQIVSPLATQLSWTHFTEVLPIKDAIQREFYLTMAAEERWTKRTLRAKIDGMLFERTAISEKPEELIRTELAALRNERKISPDMVFKSPYFLEFTGLKGNYSEETLEDTLISHIEQFLLELGDGFTFVARQKRMIIDGEDFHLDLLFFHRKLKRLIALDLKLG
ncbi:MAG: PDDEXK nuclease domain-containing protein [Muribaculaceae bacterium]